MAFVATNLSAYPQSFSIGPLKVQVMTYTAASADTTGTVTADSLQSISAIYIDGALRHSAAPTFSGNVATLAFVDPSVGGLRGTIICVGR